MAESLLKLPVIWIIFDLAASLLSSVNLTKWHLEIMVGNKLEGLLVVRIK